jgi:hypothetical protein
VQDAAGASVAAQSFTWRKPVGLVPVIEIEVKSRIAVPALVRVTGSASEAVPWVVVGKASVVTLSLTEEERATGECCVYGETVGAEHDDVWDVALAVGADAGDAGLP